MFRNKSRNNRECYRIHSKGPYGRKWDMTYNKVMKISLAKYNQPLMNHENLQASSVSLASIYGDDARMSRMSWQDNIKMSNIIMAA